MIDYAKITVNAGDGGGGGGSFVHIKGKRRGKADGGDGGRGGNVYFGVSGDLNTLEPFRFIKDYQAQRGQRGASNRRKGAEGTDLEIKVPPGTTIYLDDAEKTVIADLDSYDAKVLAARGGEGGRGNAHLRDEYGRRPLSGEKGQEGESLNLILELKLIADVGLVGMPNAGKSTLLRALTSANPKIADYPFTTLEPNLGVMKLAGPSGATSARIVLADIPGLIEGASEGRGLGDLFLRHIDRTKLIVHVIDASAEDILANYEVIRNELKKYPSDIFKKREIVALNKADLISQDTLTDLVKTFKAKKKKVVAISAQEKTGLDDLVKSIISSSL